MKSVILAWVFAMIEVVGLEIVKVGESLCYVSGYGEKSVWVNNGTDVLKDKWHPFKEYHHLWRLESIKQCHNVLVLHLAYDVHILEKSIRLDI